MSNMTQEQILREWERQVRLCSGLGYAEMLRVLQEYFSKSKSAYTTQKWRHQ